MFIVYVFFVYLIFIYYNVNNLYKEVLYYNIYKSIYLLNMFEKYIKK